MEFIAEFFVSFILDFVLQIFGELLLELGLQSLGETFARREERNPILAGIGYSLFGLIFGGLSLILFPNSFVRSERFHGINLIITPVLAGLVMGAIGRFRARHGKSLILLDSFVYGFLFAFFMALIRFFFTA